MAEVENNNTKANEKTLVKNESEAFAVVVGDFLKESAHHISRLQKALQNSRPGCRKH